MPQGWIYFVTTLEREDYPIKIGFSTEMHNRIRALQTSCPYELSIILEQPGTLEDERRLHKRFSSLKGDLVGEWFLPGKALVDYILTEMTNVAKYDDIRTMLSRRLSDDVQEAILIEKRRREKRKHKLANDIEAIKKRTTPVQTEIISHPLEVAKRAAPALAREKYRGILEEVQILASLSESERIAYIRRKRGKRSS